MRPACWAFLCVSLLAGGCVVSRPSRDWRLVIESRSDRTVFVRLGYREPDAGRVEQTFLLRSGGAITLMLANDTWDALIRRVREVTVEFCDERDRDTLQKTVVTEGELKAASWKVVYQP